MALDVQTRTLLEQMAQAGGKPLHESTPAEARELGKALAALAGPAPEMSRVEDHNVSGPGGPFPVRVLVPQQAVRGVVVYYHGGGWVIGNIDEYDTLGGLLYGLAGKIPSPGDRFEHSGIQFTIAGVRGKRITQVVVRPTGVAVPGSEGIA